MLDFIRSEDELLRHVDDAMIAEQLDLIERQEWLEKADKVREARAKLQPRENPLSVHGP